MTAIRPRIEHGFEVLAALILGHPVRTLAAAAVIFAVMLTQLPNVSLDTSMEGFLHPDDPDLLTYNRFRDQFGRDEVIIVAFRPEAVFDLKFLNLLNAVHREIENNVPHLDEVTSLVNARNTRGRGNTLFVEDLMDQWPRNEKDLAAIRQRAMSNEMYRNLLISDDGRFTAIIIRTDALSSAASDDDVMAGFGDAGLDDPPQQHDGSGAYLSDAQNTEVVEAVDRIVKKYKTMGHAVYLAGTPVVTHFLKWSMIRDMRNFMIMVIAVVAAALLMMFRRISGVLLPLLIVMVSFLSTLSIMAFNGAAIKLPTQVLPSFILAVGVGTSVHILAIFFQRLDRGDPKPDAVIFAMGHSGLAILMTNMTTAAGLVSFAGADVAPVADLGIYAGTGVLLSFVATVILLPAFIALCPIRRRKKALSAVQRTRMHRLLDGISRLSTTHPRKILGLSAAVILLSVLGAFQIRFSHYPLQWFPADNVIRTDTETIDAALRGSMTIEVILDTGVKNGWHDPRRLKTLDAAIPVMEALRYQDNYVGKAFSITNILKEINQALNGNQARAYSIPDDRRLIAQEFLLFENSGSDDLEDFVDSQFSKARFTLKFPFKDAVHYWPFQKTIRHYFSERFPDISIAFTGMISLLARTISNTITSLAESYAIAMGVITLLMVLLIGRIRIGLLSMIPNLTPILFMLGMIGWLDFPMDMFTMMVASIAIGLAVDDTIHFMHNFRRYYDASGDPRSAVYETLHTAGRAMLVTTVVLSLGFFIYMLATLNNIIRFGLLTGITLVAALLADYFLAPALMVVVNKKIQPSGDHHDNTSLAAGRYSGVGVGRTGPGVG